MTDHIREPNRSATIHFQNETMGGILNLPNSGPNQTVPDSPRLKRTCVMLYELRFGPALMPDWLQHTTADDAGVARGEAGGRVEEDPTPRPCGA